MLEEFCSEDVKFLDFVTSKYFPEHKLPENVIATTDAKAALLDADYCLHAVPVQVLTTFEFSFLFCWFDCML